MHESRFLPREKKKEKRERKAKKKRKRARVSSRRESVNPWAGRKETNHRGSILVNLGYVSFASRNSGFNNTPERRADQLCKLLFGYAFISLPPLGQSHFLHPTVFFHILFVPFRFPSSETEREKNSFSIGFRLIYSRSFQLLPKFFEI